MEKKYIYKRHDGVLIRSKDAQGFMCEIWGSNRKAWFLFPDNEDIRHSWVAAWFEGNPVDEADVPEEAKKG